MADLIHNLGIDWKILLAQVVNFTLLLILLKKFAYTPILHALNTRRDKIEDAIERSKQVDEKMAQIEILKEEVLSGARRESEKIIKRAEEAATKVQEDVLAQTHQRSERLIEEAEKKIHAEREKIFNEVKREIAGLITLSIERTMRGALDTSTRQKLVDHMLSTFEASQNS